MSEYLRSLVSDVQAREQVVQLETLLLEGLASQRLPLDEELLREIEAIAQPATR